MLSVGSNITSQTDTLKKVKVDYLYHSLRNPKPEIVSKIKQLRIVRDINIKQYGVLKRQLPYIVCGMFNPPYRRTENFAYTEYFIIDIDHIYAKGFEVCAIRQKIIADKRVVLCFTSPSEDGLKVLFKLRQRCYDSGLYSLFYKIFLKEFSTQYNLEQIIDERTSDVCRACFISIDNEAYLNPDAETIDIDTYMQSNDVCALFDIKSAISHEIKENDKNREKREKLVDPDNEVMQRVKALLHPKGYAKTKPEPYVPERLEEVISGLKTYIEETGVSVYEIKNIQYGKKLRMKMGQRLAEINLFYGKNGFSIVQSPRCGTSAEINALMADVVSGYIETLV